MRRGILATLFVALPMACGAFGKEETAVEPAADEADAGAKGELRDAKGGGGNTGEGGDGGDGTEVGDGAGPTGDASEHPTGTPTFDFEVLPVGGGCGWTVEAGDMSISVGSTAHNGTRGCTFCNTGVAGPAVVRSPEVIVTKGETYAMTGWAMRQDALKEPLQIGALLDLAPAPGGTFGDSSAGMNSSGWTKFAYTRTVESTVSRASVRLSWNMASGQCVSVDDVAITKE